MAVPMSNVNAERTRAFRPLRSIFTLLFAGVLLVVLVVLLLPSPVSPAAWTPPQPPELTGPLAPNSALQGAELIAEGRVPEPEDIAFDAQGRLYTGSGDGTIYRVTFAEGGERLEPFASTGGRPLGLAFDAAGNLVVADVDRELLSVSPEGGVSILTDEVDGTPITYADELAIASDGTVYFSDASSRFTSGFPNDMLEARPYGRLLAYDPETRTTRELLSGLYFANGVALAPDERSLLIVETFRYRITRYWLAGPQAGTSEIFADNLIGFADNITANPDGSYWVAMNNLRPAFIDRLHPSPFWKAQLAKLGTERLRQVARNNRYGLVVRYGPGGRVLESLHDPDGVLSTLSTAVPHKGSLYLGSLFEASIGRLELPHREAVSD